MKITILIMTVCLLQVSALTKAQISIDVKQESLREVLKKISQQSGYDFIYSVSDFKDAKPVDLKLNNVSLDLALRAAFYSQPLIYEVSDRTVMVRKKEEKSYIQTAIDRFQAIDVRGKVVDSLGNGLSGATVSVKNGKGSTSTAANGDFVLKNVDENATLVVYFLGYITKEVPVSKELMYVQLSQSESKLDEVQIMAYGKTTRRLSTGDVTTIRAADLEKQNIDNPLLGLIGRVPGLSIVPNSGLPGAGISVQLRGQNSIGFVGGVRLQTEPLYIVDGVPYANNLNSIGGANKVAANGMSALSFLNPSDIESIDILKDADATSIYGSRGANGVILITTKTGKKGTTNVDVSVSSGFGELPRKLKLLNTEQYLAMRKEAYENDRAELPTLPGIFNYDLTLWDQNRYTDWQKELLGGRAQQQNYKGSITGGSGLVQYIISGNYGNQGYVYPGEDYYRTAAGHLSLTGSSPNQKFRATLTANYSSNKNQSTTDFTNRAVTLAPNAPVGYKSNGELNWEPDPNTKRTSWDNPYLYFLRAAESNTDVFSVGGDLNYSIFSSLILKTNVGFNTLRGESFTPSPLTSYDPATWSTARRQSVFRDNFAKSLSFEPQLLYRVNILGGLLESIAGGSYQSQSQGWSSLTARGFASDALLRNLGSAIGTGTVQAFVGSNSSSQYKYVGVFGRINYNLQDKYILNLSARRDGSSRFGPGRQFGNFSSVGLAWVFSNEKWLKESSIMSFGKMRFSYGSSGNDGIGNYQYLELYTNNSDPVITYQGTNTLITSGVFNPGYSWESVRKLEMALDLGFLKDRILLSAVYFRNRSSNQLGVLDLPKTAGFSSNFVVNQDAEIQNMGEEFMLNSINMRINGFSWSTSANLSIQRNKLISAPLDEAGSPLGFGDARYWGLSAKYNRIGLPFSGVAYPKIFDGVDPESGKSRFLRTNGTIGLADDYSATIDEEIIITTPKFTGGINNSFTYKDFSLDIFLQFSKQKGRNYLYDSTFGDNGPGYFISTAVGNQPAEVMKRWKGIGVVTDIQRFSQDGTDGVFEGYRSMAISQKAFVDASFIRFKTVALSYNLAKSVRERLKIQNLRFFLQGQNLFTITPYKGFDPEIQSVAALPALRSVSAGIQIRL